MREATQNEFMENGRVPDRVESFGKVDSMENRRETGLGLLNHPK